MKKIASIIMAITLILNTSLATYTSTVRADGFGVVVTSEKGQTIEITPTVDKIESWQVESGNTTVTNNKFTMPEGNVVIKGLIKNALTIEMPDFTRIETRTEGTSIAIEATEEEGKQFVGWTATGITLTEEQATNNTITITMPGNAVTLTANYQAITYTITYDANGGSGAPASQTKTHGEALTLSSTKPTRVGYVFKGWATTDTATVVEYTAGSEYITNANTTLYAVWNEISLGAYITYVPSKTTSTVLGTDSGAIVADMIDYEYSSDRYETTSEEALGNHIDISDTDITESSQRKLVNQKFVPSDTTSWRVLKNNNGQLDIISTESVGYLILRGTTGYTKAVYTLNKLCEDYINPTYADSARNPGYVKGNRTSETTDTERVSNSSLPIIGAEYPLTYEDVSDYENEDESEVDIKFPYTDTLYNADVTQITTAGVLPNNVYIWLASRYWSPGVEVRHMSRSGNVGSGYLYYMASDWVCSYGRSNGIRPIVSLKSGVKITGGEGTLASPYTISID